MRRDVTFTSQGLRCAGWLYVPDDLPAGQKLPAIVMANALSSVKEIYLSNYAERFLAAGFVTLVFDYRYFGASEGEPRGQMFPYEQQEDIRNAITWISDQPEVDSNRIGGWGMSYGGAHMMYLAAYDKRLTAVVATVPSMNNWETFLRNMGSEGLAQFLGFLTQDRIARYKTGVVNYMKVVTTEAEPSMIPGPEAYEFYTQAANTIAPYWHNQVTLESLEKAVEYNPTSPIHLISPTPLLMVVSKDDQYIPSELTTAAYERALEPKDLIILPCSHIDVYNTEPWVSKAADEAVKWFKQHLG